MTPTLPFTRKAEMQVFCTSAWERFLWDKDTSPSWEKVAPSLSEKWRLQLSPVQTFILPLEEWLLSDGEKVEVSPWGNVARLTKG